MRDPEPRRRVRDARGLAFGDELPAVHADDEQLARESALQLLQVRHDVQAVDAALRPEVEQHDAAAQIGERQRATAGVEPVEAIRERRRAHDARCGEVVGHRGSRDGTIGRDTRCRPKVRNASRARPPRVGAAIRRGWTRTRCAGLAGRPRDKHLMRCTSPSALAVPVARPQDQHGGGRTATGRTVDTGTIDVRTPAAPRGATPHAAHHVRTSSSRRVPSGHPTCALCARPRWPDAGSPRRRLHSRVPFPARRPLRPAAHDAVPRGAHVAPSRRCRRRRVQRSLRRQRDARAAPIRRAIPPPRPRSPAPPSRPTRRSSRARSS